MSKFAFLLFIVGTATMSKAYELPIAKFKIFYPKGFEVSIPADENVTLFGFHGKLNEPLDGLEAGRWSKDILKSKDGRFTFKDDQTSLKLGDTIYYWTHAINNGLGYREDDGTYVVREYTQKSEQNNVYKVPKAEFKVFYPKGFEVSIPAEENVTHFAFHGKLNEQLHGLEAGRWSKDISNRRNGRYVFEDRETSLKVGDVIYYWTFVINNGVGYREDDGAYVVREYSFIDEYPTFTRKPIAAIGFKVPTAEFKIFYPKGFEVSIPAEEGISLFAFHGKLNERIIDLEAGRWSRDVTTRKNGRFVFEDRQSRLTIGDTIYYWTYVMHNGIGYREDDGVYLVTKYSSAREDIVSTTPRSIVAYRAPTVSNVPVRSKVNEVSTTPRSIAGYRAPTVSNVPVRSKVNEVSTTPTSIAGYRAPTVRNVPLRSKVNEAFTVGKYSSQREVAVPPTTESTVRYVQASGLPQIAVRNNLDYKEDESGFLVTRFLSPDENSVSSTTVATVGYKVPNAEFKIFYPKGFEVSIPAEDGVSLFTFHGKLNEKMHGLEAGRWSAEVTTRKNGRFVFEDRETSLKLGDVIYYWTFVNHNGLGYREDDGAYLVAKFTSQAEVSVTTTTEANVGYKVPIAQFKIFYPRGFEVSIPAEENITLFAFHGKLNEEMEGLEAGKWARDIVTPKNEKFSFRERETSLEIGDTIYYWTYVVYNGLGYREDDGVYVVTHYTPQDGNKSASIPLFPVLTETATPTLKSISTLHLGDCRPSITTINNGIPADCSEQIIFEENFNDNRVDPKKWSMERRFAFQPDYEFVIYLLNNEVLRVGNGMATVKPVPLTRIYGEDILTKEFSLGPNCTGILDTEDCIRSANSLDILPPFISSQFSTKARFSFKYGKVEIRAKMPNAAWVYPQLFLDPVDSRYGAKNYQSGQMRVAFSRSSGGGLVNELFGGVILNAELPYRNVKMCKRIGPPVDWSADFHVYQMEWLPNQITFSVDNEEYCIVKPDRNRFSEMQVNGKYLPNKEYLKTGSVMAPFDQEFYIRLGYGIGGHNDFPDDTTLWLKEKPWMNFHPKSMRHFWNKQKRNWNHWLGPDASLKIDYVRVYSS